MAAGGCGSYGGGEGGAGGGRVSQHLSSSARTYLHERFHGQGCHLDRSEGLQALHYLGVSHFHPRPDEVSPCSLRCGGVAVVVCSGVRWCVCGGVQVRDRDREKDGKQARMEVEARRGGQGAKPQGAKPQKSKVASRGSASWRGNGYSLCIPF